MPLALLFLIQALHAAILDWHNYTDPKWLREDRVHLLLIVLRLLLTAAHIVPCFSEIPPYIFLPLQAGLCLVQLLLLHMMYKVWPVSSYRDDPLIQMPQLLNAMRVHRKYARTKHINGEPTGDRCSMIIAPGMNGIGSRLFEGREPDGDQGALVETMGHLEA